MKYTKEELEMSIGTVCSFHVARHWNTGKEIEIRSVIKEGKLIRCRSDITGHVIAVVIECEDCTHSIHIDLVENLPAVNQMRKTKLYKLKSSTTITPTIWAPLGASIVVHNPGANVIISSYS